MQGGDNIRFLRVQNDWALKLFCIVFYLYWAWTYAYGAGDALLLLFVWAVLYWLFVLRQYHHSRRLKREHWIILGILLLLLLIAKASAMIPLIAVGAVFWFAVEKRGHLSRGTAPYNLRYHMLNAIVVNAVLVMVFMLLRAAVGLLTALLSPLGVPVEAILLPVLGSWPLLIVIVNVALAVVALLDRTPRIPWLSRMLDY